VQQALMQSVQDQLNKSGISLTAIG
jgi:hypothetical protein